MAGSRGINSLTGNSTGTSQSIAVPTGVCVGDLLLLVIGFNATTVPSGLTVPTGWTQRLSQPGVVSSSLSLVIYTKVCVAADKGSSPSISWTGSTGHIVGMTAYTGVDVTDPIEEDAALTDANSGGVTAASFPMTVEARVDSHRVSVSVQSSSTSPYASAPAGETIDINSAFSSYAMMVSSTSAVAGNPGSPTGTLSNGSCTTTTARLSLRPMQVPQRRDWIDTAPVASTSQTFNVAGITLVPGDLKVLTVFFASTTATATAPTGWTEVLNQVVSAAGYSVVVYTRTHVSGDPTSVVVGFSASVTTFGSASAWSGASGIDAIAATGSAGSTSLTAPAVTETADNDVLVTTHMTATGTVSITTPPPGMTAFGPIQSGTSNSVVSYSEAESTAVTTEARVVVVNVSAATVGVTYALKRADKAPTVRQVTPTGGSDLTSGLTVNMPSDVQDGDLLFMMVAVNATMTMTTPPSGWTLLDSATASTPSFWLYTKTASSEPSSYSVTLSGTVTTANFKQAVVVAVKGPGNNIDAHTGSVSSAASSKSNATVTTTLPNDLIVLFAYTPVSTSPSGPIGTETLSLSNVGCYVATQAQAPTGATGTFPAWHVTGSHAWDLATVAVSQPSTGNPIVMVI